MAMNFSDPSAGSAGALAVITRDFLRNPAPPASRGIKGRPRLLVLLPSLRTDHGVIVSYLTRPSRSLRIMALARGLMNVTLISRLVSISTCALLCFPANPARRLPQTLSVTLLVIPLPTYFHPLDRGLRSLSWKLSSVENLPFQTRPVGLVALMPSHSRGIARHATETSHNVESPHVIHSYCPYERVNASQSRIYPGEYGQTCLHIELQQCHMSEIPAMFISCTDPSPVSLQVLHLCSKSYPRISPGPHFPLV